MLRGLAKVRGEWNLVCAAFNLRRPSTRGRMRLRRAGENPPPVRGAE